MIEEKTQTHHMSDCTVRGLFCMDEMTHVTHLSSPQTQTQKQSLPYKKKKNKNLNQNGKCGGN